MNVSAKRVLLQYYKPLINSQPKKLESRYTCIGKFVSITVFKSEMNMYSMYYMYSPGIGRGKHRVGENEQCSHPSAALSFHARASALGDLTIRLAATRSKKVMN